MRKVLFIVGLIIALGSGIGLYLQWNNAKDLMPVVYAATNIPEDTALSQQQLTVQNVPRESVPDGVASNISQVAGKTLNWPLKKGDPVRVDKVEQNAKTPISNSRLISFKVDYNGSIAGLAQYGQTVDVVLTVDANKQASTPLTGYVITNLFIEATADAAGNIISSVDSPYINKSSGSSITGNGQVAGIPSEIIAKVTPRQFLVLKQAESMGTLSLGKRSQESNNFYNINEYIEKSNMSVSSTFVLNLLEIQSSKSETSDVTKGI
ncbi:Flp pilus assembly protein CpaB [Dehalobacter sp. TeCB1]|uniref:Flp pilus assembly protein CpaB n=1 Tax=Dehalobacter sp. TeCB1 TaxID=1843715 RepID=UPI00083AA47C|nr:Flp pilus assembly protein CpaB [Dehalobacter sp. TeCB1]OCZ51353.1 Flp pilus assembly protein CpaB [Dehalobacter sp. TeCB1]